MRLPSAILALLLASCSSTSTNSASKDSGTDSGGIPASGGAGGAAAGGAGGASGSSGAGGVAGGIAPSDAAPPTVVVSCGTIDCKYTTPVCCVPSTCGSPAFCQDNEIGCVSAFHCDDASDCAPAEACCLYGSVARCVDRLAPCTQWLCHSDPDCPGAGTCGGALSCAPTGYRVCSSS